MVNNVSCTISLSSSVNSHYIISSWHLYGLGIHTVHSLLKHVNLPILGAAKLLLFSILGMGVGISHYPTFTSPPLFVVDYWKIPCLNHSSLPSIPSTMTYSEETIPPPLLFSRLLWLTTAALPLLTNHISCLLHPLWLIPERYHSLYRPLFPVFFHHWLHL